MAFLLHALIIFAIYAILAISLNLILGYTGLISVTHAAFFGIGAYATAILTTTYGLDFYLSLLVGIICATVSGLAVGLILSRLGGDYFVLGTVGFNFVVFTLLQVWESLTSGTLGIPGIARPKLWHGPVVTDAEFFIFALVWLAMVYGLYHLVAQSSFGRVLKAIREDEKAIEVFGYRTLYFKLAVFVLGAAGAAIAGSLYASYITYIDPSTFTVVSSITILSMVVVGGLGNLKGSLLGALLLVFLPELLRQAGFSQDIAAQLQQLTYGLALVLLMLYRPRGLVGEYKF